MTTSQLFPKPPRRMKRPRKATLYQIIRNRDAEVYRLRAEVERIPRWLRAIARILQAFRLHPGDSHDR